MIVVVRPDASAEQLRHLLELTREFGLIPQVSRGEHHTVVGCIGEDARRYADNLRAAAGVEKVLPVEKPYKRASREFAVGCTVVEIADEVSIGGEQLEVIAGPCSVEGREMMIETARAVAGAGAGLMRGGAFKPRTSPYSFRGLGEEGLQYMADAREATGLPVVTEVLDPRDLALVDRYADVLQIGARNMQNYGLLEAVGGLRTPVLLKRGMSATVRDLLLAAEYVLNAGNQNVILCERGVRTFGEATRNTFDLGAVALLKRETHLPVVADPSHATGRRDLVVPMAAAAVAAGADGLIVEVHPDPEHALSDGDQSLTPGGFEAMMERVSAHAAVIGRPVRGAGAPTGLAREGGERNSSPRSSDRLSDDRNPKE